MNTSLGPWTTAIHDRSRAQLGTFWKRRLRTLPAVSGAHPPTSAAAAGVLVVTLLVTALPTLLSASATSAAPSTPTPSDSDAPPPAKPDHTAWGETLDGLQAGLRFADERAAYRTGETVQLEVVVRNVGAEQIDFSHLQDVVFEQGTDKPVAGMFHEFPPTVIDDRDEKLNIPTGEFRSGRVPVKRHSLASGETATVGHAVLALQSPDLRGPVREPTLVAGPGLYRVSQRFSIQRQPGANEWLTTGTLELRIVARAANGPGNVAAADDDGAPAGTPTLAFLSSDHRKPENDDEPLRGTYWLPSGERVTDHAQLAPLRRIIGIRDRGAGNRFAHVFVSHAGFRGPSVFGMLDVLNADGTTIDDSLLRLHPWATNFAFPPDVREQVRRPGWQYFWLNFDPGVDMPQQALLRLEYTQGAGRRLATVPVDAVADTEIVPGIRLREISQTERGHASFAIAIDAERNRDHHYHVRALNAAGQPLPGEGHQTEPAGRFTHTFRVPLKDVASFELLEWRKRVVEFKDVALRPVD